MTDAAMQADYCDLKIIKTRKVIQVVLEIPQEAGNAFIAAFGLPRSDKNVPVAIARLNEPTLLDLDVVKQIGKRPKGGKLAQRAGIVCGEPGFKKYLLSHHPYIEALGTPAQYLRSYCGVVSRAELDHDAGAAKLFDEMMREYSAWQSHG
jgi:hypothetical protein